MILRRLTQSLKAQNRTAIWIEFVLLVLGVFLGIQVSNWNAARAEDAKAQAYLARIHGNLESDVQSIHRRELDRRTQAPQGPSLSLAGSVAEFRNYV